MFADATDNAGSAATADILDPPTGLAAKSDRNAIKLGWTATPDTYAVGHRVFLSTSLGGPYTQIAELTPRSVTGFEDARKDGTYYYVVRAFTPTWESVDSNPVRVLVSGG